MFLYIRVIISTNRAQLIVSSGILFRLNNPSTKFSIAFPESPITSTTLKAVPENSLYLSPTSLSISGKVDEIPAPIINDDIIADISEGRRLMIAIPNM